ncbi:MAG: hypothetical protein H7Y12_03645 [Sphingobacteriaceae bacterium]|nr:hypothetical protein [Cytophagaceae bacterium]
MPKPAIILILLVLTIALPALAQSSLLLKFPESQAWNVVEEGKSIQFSVQASGDSARIATFGLLDGKLEGMLLDSLGEFSWTPDYTLVDRVAGSKLVQVVFEARTPGGQRVTRPVEFRVLHVNRAPKAGELKPCYVQYNTVNNCQIDPNVVLDEDKDPLVFIPIPDQMPEGAKLSAQGELTWKPSLTQFNRLKTSPMWMEFWVEDQPAKTRTKGRMKLDVTQQDLPPELSVVPNIQTMKVRENATINLAFYLNDPNGESDLETMGFLSDNPNVPRPALKRNANTQYEFTWQPGYGFVNDPLDSLAFTLTFFVLDKTGKRDEQKVAITVVNTINEREKDLQLFNVYRTGLVRAWELIEQLDEKQETLKDTYNRARKGKRHRSIINAGMGAMTGLSPVVLSNTQQSKLFSTIGGTTVLTVGTLEATEVIGKSIKDVLDRLNYVIQKKNELQTKGDIFARKYNLKSARRKQDFARDLDDFVSTMNVSGLVALELDAGWQQKHKATDTRLEKTFKDYSRFEE